MVKKKNTTNLPVVLEVYNVDGLRPPLSKKSFPVGRVGGKKLPVGRSGFFIFP